MGSMGGYLAFSRSCCSLVLTGAHLPNEAGPEIYRHSSMGSCSADNSNINTNKKAVHDEQASDADQSKLRFNN